MECTQVGVLFSNQFIQLESPKKPGQVSRPRLYLLFKSD